MSRYPVQLKEVDPAQSWELTQDEQRRWNRKQQVVHQQYQRPFYGWWKDGEREAWQRVQKWRSLFYCRIVPLFERHSSDGVQRVLQRILVIEGIKPKQLYRRQKKRWGRRK